MNIKSEILKQSKKIQRIDIILFLFGLLCVGLFYLFFKRDVVFIPVRIKVADENILYAVSYLKNEYTRGFVIGDTEKDEFGRTVSEIINVETYNISPTQKNVYVDVKVKTIYNPKRKIYSVRGKDIVFGESLTFTFSNVRLKGLIVDFPGFKPVSEEVTKKITVIAQNRQDSRYYSDTYGVPDFMANAIKIGDEVRDSKGNIRAKILDVSIVPAKRTIITQNNQAIQIQDSSLKDVYYTIELDALLIHDSLYTLDYIPVLVGSLIPINLSHVSIQPTIIEIIK